jgi:adenylosuccinate synthase
MDIQKVDICCGLNWGDEAKGKIIAQLAKSGTYQFVCRWAGGHNAGHTVYVDGKKFKTHLIPCGIFYGIPSIIGPDCVVNKDAFEKEINYLRENGFDINLIKISPKTHIVSETHIEEDIKQYSSTQGSTSQGIAPCYRDKYARRGLQVKNDPFFKNYQWNEKLYGNILCEGAQGVWLDINHGEYPYVTSSTTLPYGSCSLGFPTHYIDTIYGATKIYDTRSGIDPLFPESLLDDPELKAVAECGNEYGTTTGRRRKVNWLNVDKLIQAIQISGSTHIIISKADILEKVEIFKFIHENKIQSFPSLHSFKEQLESLIKHHCKIVKAILFSDNVETVDGLMEPTNS